MAGRGKMEAPSVPNPAISAFSHTAPSSRAGGSTSDNSPTQHRRAECWQAATDPLHADRPEKAGVGPGMPFARAVLEKLGHGYTIGLVPCAWGGSAIARWMPEDGDLFHEALRRARKALTSEDDKLAGILWHQGESDCGQAQLAVPHAQATVSVLSGLRESLGVPELPVVVGELGYFIDQVGDERFRYASVVNQGLVTMGDRFSHSCCVSAAGMGHLGDRLHFDSAAQEALGKRYAAGWCKLVADQYDCLHTELQGPLDEFCFPQPEAEAQVAATTTTAVLD